MSQRPLPPEHVAYMQVIASEGITAHSIVYPAGTVSEDGIVHATSHITPDSTCMLGVADTAISAGSRGTIIVAGVVTLYGSAFTPGASSKFGHVIFADKVLPEPKDEHKAAIIPIGTLLSLDVPGMTDDRSGTYTHGGRVFLCSWMSAFTIPRTRGEGSAETSVAATTLSSEVEEWTTVYTEDGVPQQKRIKTIKQQEIRDMPSGGSSAGKVDLKTLMGTAAVDAMVSTLGNAFSHTGELTQEQKDYIQSVLVNVATVGINDAKSNHEVVQRCFIQ